MFSSPESGNTNREPPAIVEIFCNVNGSVDTAQKNDGGGSSELENAVA